MPVSYRSTNALSDIWLVAQHLTDLDRYYPGFSEWFVNKVMPGVVLAGDPFVVAEDAGEVVGMAIGRGGAHPKLRCVRVLPRWQHRGVGLHLIDRVLRRLGCDRPQASVAQELIHDWSRVFVNRYDFRLSHVHKGLYRPGCLEYEFNGPPGGTSARSAY